MKTRIIYTIALIYFSVATVSAQSKNNYVLISGSKLSYPIIEVWIKEFKKTNPSAQIAVLNSSRKADSVNL